MTFAEYKEEIEKRFGVCDILDVTMDIKLKNADKTGDRDAYNYVDWIDYWRAITEKFATTLKCSSCGKTIIIGEPSEAQRRLFSLGDDTVAKHKAEGGHIWITAPEGANYSGGRYITPLCPSCNAKRGQQITIKKGSVLCKEKGAIITNQK